MTHEADAASTVLPVPATGSLSDDDDADPTVRPIGRRRNVAWVAALVALVGVAGGAWWIGSSTQSPDQAAARADPPEASWITAPVEFRVLSSTIVTRGDVRPATRTDVRVPVSVEGDPVVTRDVTGVGDVVDSGDLVVEISGRPVFAMAGDVASFRSLLPGMSGDDVAALQQGLVGLGYRIDEDGVFGPQTKAAVTEFYAAGGYTPVPTSTTFSADIAAAERAVTDARTAADTAQSDFDDAAAGPAGSEVATADAAVGAGERAVIDARATRTESVDAAEIAVDVAKASRDDIHARPDITVDEFNSANVSVHDAEIALANAIRDNDAAVEAAEDQLTIAQLARGELDEAAATADLQTALDTANLNVTDAEAALAELQRVNGPTVAQGEIIFVTQTPTRVLSVNGLDSDATAVPGDPQSQPSSGAVVSLASGDLIVTGSLRPDQAGLVAIGLEAELLDEVRNVIYPATVTAIAAEPVTGADGQVANPITVTPDEPLPDEVTGTNLRVTLTAASTGTEQLVVPVAAVNSSADGTVRVTLLDKAGAPVEIEVIAGLSADGFIAIEPANPDSLTVTDEVIVGR